MKIYETMIEVKTPLVHSGPKTGNLLVHSRQEIPGLTLRGAFLAKPWREGKKDLVKRELKDPKLFFHPAYPVVNDETAKPAHPFMYECKVCGEIFVPKSFEEPKRIASFNFETYNPPYICRKGKHIFSTKSIGGALVFMEGNSYIKHETTYSKTEAIGINRVVKGAEIKMLYGYVAVSPGSIFKGLIIDLSNRMEELGFLDEEIIDLFIGGAISRGYGHVEVKISEKKGYIKRESDRIKKTLELFDGKIILIAISPVFSLSFLNEKLTSTPTIDLGRMGIKAEPLLIYKDLNYVLTETTRVSGFSLLSNLPKVSIEAAEIGSLYFFKTENDLNPTKIAERELLGFGSFSNVGLNILEVFPFVQ